MQLIFDPAVNTIYRIFLGVVFLMNIVLAFVIILWKEIGGMRHRHGHGYCYFYYADIWLLVVSLLWSGGQIETNTL